MPSATPPPPAPPPSGPGATAQGDAAALQALARSRERLVDQLHRRIVGQHGVIDLLLTCLFAGGHGLFVGVPGLAKTLLVSSLAQCTGLEFSRVQFTPDLMPSDITGSEVLEEDPASGRRQFRFVAGPVFCNLLLADEINRTPPKTQAALLEAMQERRVTLDGTAHPLPANFLVVATQNPIESQGVYPLPEAQLDRFLFKLLVPYPSAAEEARIVSTFGQRAGPQRPADFGIEAVANPGLIAAAAQAVKSVTLADSVVDYVVSLIRATRDSADLAAGASPRAAVLLANAARARAALDARDYVLPDDVKALANAVLRHRLLLSPAAEIEGKQVEALVADLVEATEAPR